MHLYQVIYRLDDKKDKDKEIDVSECYASESFELVYDKVKKYIKAVDGELVSIKKFDPILGVLKKDNPTREETRSDMELKDKIMNWLAHGERGISSETLAFKSIGIDHESGYAPSDPSDFNRCLKLVDAIPEIKLHFDSIAKISDKWKKVIDNWDKLEKMFCDEVGRNWSKSAFMPAEKTYNFMRSLKL